MKIMDAYKQELNNSASIKQEILRFEGVHPSIYAVYELIQGINDVELQSQIRDHIINIEDAFVNSQEWTLGRSVAEIRLVSDLNCFVNQNACCHRGVQACKITHTR